MILHIFVVTIFFAIVTGQNCPQGGKIHARGVSTREKNDIINAHNQKRLDIANGRVPGQPKGIDLLRMVFDSKLSEEPKKLSDLCAMMHKKKEDKRWPSVGKNLFIEWDYKFNKTADWGKVVNSWFSEYKNYTYPRGPKKPGQVVGNYTQVVWANSKHVGCNFLFYKDVSQPEYPYAKLYTCNYGPSGNYIGQAPYKTGTSGCENLC